ncbi:MAG: alpha/beta fold hydrolase [Leptospiraceae bacterium]|nr:alpha/beta fold hydrolase [Leptospiraceae bacterium]
MNSKLLPADNGINLFVEYSDPGFPNADTIFFLHGYPDTHKTWEKQIDFFKNHFKIINADIRGAGQSSPPRDRKGYQSKELINDVNKIINEFVSRDSKVHLVGHDWGAVIFWSYLSNPENQRRIHSFSAVACPHPSLFFKNTFGKMFSFNPKKIGEGWKQFAKSYYILLFQLPFVPEFLWENFTEDIWEFVMTNSGLSESDKMNFLTKEEVVSFTKNNINLYREALQSGFESLPPAPLNIPVSLFIPEDDTLISPEVYDESESIVSKLRTFRIQANHWIHRERPEWFNQKLYQFLIYTSK